MDLVIFTEEILNGKLHFLFSGKNDSDFSQDMQSSPVFEYQININ